MVRMFPVSLTRGRLLAIAGLALLITLAISLLTVATHSHAAGAVKHYGPIHSTSPDSGTCGNNWATDTFDRFFTADTSPNADGTYSVTEQFKNGTFITSAGPSPEGCGKDPGGTVGAGITGKMQGEFTIVVSGGTFNPNATCTAATCGTTAGFVSTVYGASATYDVPTFEVHYNAQNHGDWKNASADRGGDQGDITGNP